MAGFKDFADGNFFTAAEVDGYLMRQSIMRFTTTANLLSQLGSVAEKGMHAWADDTETEYVYTTGGVWKPVFSLEKTYTPVWTAGGTNVTRGNGSESGTYWVEGPGVIGAKWKFTLGTTSNPQTGAFAWGLPQTVQTDLIQAGIVGEVGFNDASTGNYYVRWAICLNNSGSFGAINHDAVRFSTTSPVAPTTSDTFTLNLRYRSNALDIS